MKLKQLKVKTINEAIEDTAIAKDYVGTMGFVMADAINISKKKREDVKKIIEERGKDLPNQDRYAHMKNKGTPEMKKMHLSEDAFQTVDLRNRGNRSKNRKSLREDVNTNKLISFLKEAYADLTNNSESVWYYDLGNGVLYYVMAAAGNPINYDEEDVEIFARSYDNVSEEKLSKLDPQYNAIIVGKIAVNSDDMQADYDWDWTMPYGEDDGEVWNTEREFYKEENFELVAREIVSEYNKMKDLKISPDGVILPEGEALDSDGPFTIRVDDTESLDITYIYTFKDAKDYFNKYKEQGFAKNLKLLDSDDNVVISYDNPNYDKNKRMGDFRIYFTEEDGSKDYEPFWGELLPDVIAKFNEWKESGDYIELRLEDENSEEVILNYTRSKEDNAVSESIAKDGKIIESNKVEESLDVSQTNPIDTTKSIAGRKSMKEGTDNNHTYYGLFQVGGSVGELNGYSNKYGKILYVFDSEHVEDAKDIAKRRRKSLSKGERSYYKISYTVKPLSSVDLKNEYVKSLIDNKLNGPLAESFKKMGGRKPIKESTTKIMDAEEFLDWHDKKVNPKEESGKLSQIYHIFELNGCSEDDDVDYCYDMCDDKQKREIMDIILTESFLNETDDVDSKKCADILNNWIDWEEADYDSDKALDQLRSLQTEKAITEKEYDFIVKNWDDLLEENFTDDNNKEELTEGVKFGQSSYEDLVNTVCEYYVDHSGKDALESILNLMKDLDEDNAYKLLYAVAEKVEEFVGEELEDSQKYPIESPFDKKEGKGGLKADQKYPIKPSGEKKDSQFVKAEQKAPVGLTESVETIGFNKVLPIIKDWCGNILGEEDCENLAQEFSIGMSNGENCFDIMNRVASQYGLDVDEFEGICGDIESTLNESKSDSNKKKLEEDLKVYLDDLSSFEPWSGAVETWEKIVDAKKLDTLSFMLEDMYPDGISEVELNDLLRFDSEWVLDMVGVSDGVSDEEEDTDGQDDVTDIDDETEESTKNTTNEEVSERSEYDVDVSQEEADAIAESLLNMMNTQDNN